MFKSFLREVLGELKMLNVCVVFFFKYEEVIVKLDFRVGESFR